ncbi:MAG: STAS domain-containing protein [Magnetococcus sp. WYHC-3]
MEIHYQESDTWVYVRLCGDFTLDSRQAFRALIEKVGLHRQILVDFAGVGRMDSTALGELLHLRNRMDAVEPPPITLMDPAANLHGIFLQAGFDRLFLFSSCDGTTFAPLQTLKLPSEPRRLPRPRLDAP